MLLISHNIFKALRDNESIPTIHIYPLTLYTFLYKYGTTIVKRYFSITSTQLSVHCKREWNNNCTTKNGCLYAHEQNTIACLQNVVKKC